MSFLFASIEVFKSLNLHSIPPMNKPVDHLLASMKNLRLKEDERKDTREVLEARIRFPHAFRILDAAASEVSLLPSEKQLARVGLTEAIHRCKRVYGFDIFAAFSLKRFVALFSAVLIAFSTGGGVLAYAAEEALPGDALYPVKVSLSEPAIALFHRTPQAKARWAEKKLERRLREAEKLALRASVDPEIEETITLSMEHAEQEAERNSLSLGEEERREEFAERLRQMKERQRNVVGRFKEKRMKKSEIRLLEKERDDVDDEEESREDRTRGEKLRVFLSGSGEVRKGRSFSSSAVREKILKQTEKMREDDDKPFRIRLETEKPLSPKFREIIRSPEDSPTEDREHLSEDAMKELRKGSKDKLRLKNSL